MNFLKEGKTNWKFILIVIVLAIIVAGFSWWGLTHIFIEPWDMERWIEIRCINSGGKVTNLLCCKTSGDFPNACLIGACGCSSENSHQVKVCDCGLDKCFDGEKCVYREATIDETANWKTYENEEYGFEIKYPEEWLVIEDDFRKNITNTQITNWGDPNDHCLFFDTNIDKENKDVVVHLFISDLQWARNLCEQKSICHYDKNNPIFSNKKEVYEWTGSSAYDWVVVGGKDKFIGVFVGLDLEEGRGYVDRIGTELREKLNKLILTSLESIIFK